MLIPSGICNAMHCSRYVSYFKFWVLVPLAGCCSFPVGGAIWQVYCRRGRGRHWQISLLCFFKLLCTALFYFSVLRFHISHQRTQVYCCIVRERGRSPHPPLLTFCPASMLLLIHIHAYAYTFPLLYFNLHNSLGQPLVKKEATDWDFIICKSGWSTLAYNILHIGLEPKIKKAISDH